MHFYLTPPTGNSCPLKVIYPVIDNDSLTGTLSMRDTRQVTMVIPADGPSFFIPPAGKCKWTEIFYNSSTCSVILKLPSLQMAKSFLFDRIHDRAMFILYFIVLPSWPVTSIIAFEFGYFTAYTSNIFPPISVQAMPFTIPTPDHRSSCLMGPRIFTTVSIVIACF